MFGFEQTMASFNILLQMILPAHDTHDRLMAAQLHGFVCCPIPANAQTLLVNSIKYTKFRVVAQYGQSQIVSSYDISDIIVKKRSPPPFSANMYMGARTISRTAIIIPTYSDRFYRSLHFPESE